MDPEAKAVMLEELAYQIQQEIEFLETTEGDPLNA